MPASFVIIFFINFLLSAIVSRWSESIAENKEGRRVVVGGGLPGTRKCVPDGDRPGFAPQSRASELRGRVDLVWDAWECSSPKIQKLYKKCLFLSLLEGCSFASYAVLFVVDKVCVCRRERKDSSF